MELRVQQASVTEIDTPLLVVSVVEGQTQPSGITSAVDAALGGQISRLIAAGEITGEPATVTVIHTDASPGLKAQRVAVAGLGKQAELELENVRVASALAARKARDLKVDSFASVVHDPGTSGLSSEDVARVTMESSILALYRYEQFKEATKSRHEVSSCTIVEPDAGRARQFEQTAELARITCDAMMKVRDLSVGPANFVTPTYLAEQAREIAQKFSLEITVWGKDELRAHGMNAILAVNFVQLAAEGKLPVSVLGVFAATENLPSGSAYKPGDVFKAYNGKTMEIVNTDAEGRVILSDSLAYAAEQKPDAIVDFATLTGACRVALGDHATGLMSNNQTLADQLLAAGERSGDRCWQLPLWKVYGEQIKTAMADVRNTGGRPAGAITAGLFLKEFVGDVPWVHLDIAGTAYADGDQTYVAPYNPKPGATGVGVRLLWHFCQAWKDA